MLTANENSTNWREIEAARVAADEAKAERLERLKWSEFNGTLTPEELTAASTNIHKVDRKPIGTVPDRNWYMLTVRPNHELEAVDSFRRNGVRAYWPNYSRLAPGRLSANGFRSRQKMLSGVVPGYIFTPGSPSEDLTLLLERVTGVVNVLRSYSGGPIFLSEAHIDLIRKIEAGLNTPDPPKTTHKLKVGMKVRFSDDSQMLWPPGRIVEIAHNGKVTVEVKLEKGGSMPIKCLPHQIVLA